MRSPFRHLGAAALAAALGVLSPVASAQSVQQAYAAKPGEPATFDSNELIGSGHHFFGTISHDRLVALVAKRVADSKVLSLIRQILTAGVLRDGVYESTIAGTPQGGVISPLLSNIICTFLTSRCSGRDSNLRATLTIGYAYAGLARKRNGRWRAPVRC